MCAGACLCVLQSKVKLFSPQSLLVCLQQRLPLLTGGAHDLPARQQTLRDAIDWSHDLLTPAEQVLFRRLAVFASGATLEAVQAVCDGVGDPSDVEQGLGVD